MKSSLICLSHWAPYGRPVSVWTSYSDSSSPAAGSTFFIVVASTLTTQVINYTPCCTPSGIITDLISSRT
jgi:hypothetical protein